MLKVQFFGFESGAGGVPVESIYFRGRPVRGGLDDVLVGFIVGACLRVIPSRGDDRQFYGTNRRQLCYPHTETATFVEL